MNMLQLPEITNFRFQSEYLVLLLVSLIILWIIFKRLARKQSWLNELPSPPSYPLFGGLHHFADLKLVLGTFWEWCTNYGPIFRFEGIFNEPYIVLNDPNYVQAILSLSDIAAVSKPRIPYDSVLGQFLKNGLFVSKGDYWKSHRRIMTKMFTYNAFQNYTTIFNKLAIQLVDELDQLFPSDNSGDCYKPISSLMHRFSLQIICSSVMGLDSCGSDDGAVFCEMFQKYKVISSEKAVKFWYLIDFIWKLHPRSREYTKIISTLNETTRKIIEKEQKMIELKRGVARNGLTLANTSNSPAGKKSDWSMIEEMITAGMTSEEILTEVNTLLAAGFETTALTAHFLLFLLALNPACQQECQNEIDKVFSDSTKCPDGNLTAEALSSEIKYLERCCFETLRIFPAIFFILRKPEKAVKLDEKLVLPAGTNAVIPIYSLHRDAECFPDPEKFDPDRFLPEKCKKRHTCSYIPFSNGIRNCIGMKFAILEVKAVAAHILRNFDVSVLEKFDTVPVLPSIVLTPQTDYRFKLKRRLL